MECNNTEYYYNFVIPIIKEAGNVSTSNKKPQVKKLHAPLSQQLIVEAKDYTTECKDVVWDLVTEYDLKVEETLIKKIKEKFPSHRFIGEEDSSAKKNIPVLTDHPTWIIDPIDGTANFVRKLPITCISVGLVINKEQVLGIVYNPFLNELYTAIKGKGAYLNGKRIQCSNTEGQNKNVPITNHSLFQLQISQSPF